MTTKYHTYLAKVTNLVAAASDSDVKCVVAYNSLSVDVSIDIPTNYTSSDYLTSNALGYIANLVSIASIYPSVSRVEDGSWFVTFSFPFGKDDSN